MIQAKTISYSQNEFGDKLFTVEVIMPRHILAEVNTHRMLSKNSASSRAIPFNKMVQSVQDNPFIPIAWQEQHSGMQGTEYLNGIEEESAIDNWLLAKDSAIKESQCLYSNNVTKQLANRLLEPFMYHKVLISGTDSGWQNFFELRCPSYDKFKSWKEVIKNAETNGANDVILHELESYSTLERLKLNKGMAEIHMMALAEAIYDEYQNSSIDKDSIWHLPYASEIKDIRDNIYISTARCARTSYTTPDISVDSSLNLEKDIQLHDRLLLNKPPHASPAEHPARKMTNDEYFSFQKVYIVNQLTEKLQDEHALGKTQIIALGDGYYRIIEYGWCNNYRGFIQYRYLIENNLPI